MSFVAVALARHAGTEGESASLAPPTGGDAVIVWNANAGVAATAACLAPLNNPLHESRIYTYVFSGPLDYPIGGASATPGSQYLLYENRVFGLRYDAFAGMLLGTYQQNNGTITFRFDGRWTSNQGNATGTLKGALMEVRYSEIMQHSDFENAVYRRVP